MAEVPTEVGMELLVGIEPKKFPDRLDRRHFTIGQHRRLAALAELVRKDVAEDVIGEAEHRKMKLSRSIAASRG